MVKHQTSLHSDIKRSIKKEHTLGYPPFYSSKAIPKAIMKNHRLIGSGIGVTTYKGNFAALILKLKTKDHQETLTSWGRQSIVELLHVLSQYLAIEKKVESTDQHNTSFDQASPALTQDESTAPGLKSVVRNITSQILDGELELRIIFHHDGSSIKILLDDIAAQILMGWSCHALLGVKELDSVIQDVSAFCFRKPLVIFDCKVNSIGEIDYTDRRAYDIDYYRSLPYLYGIAIMIKEGEKKRVAGGFFVKTPVLSAHPQFSKIIRDSIDALDILAGLDRDRVSLVSSIVHSSDGEAPDVKDMNAYISQMHLQYGHSGSA